MKKVICRLCLSILDTSSNDFEDLVTTPREILNKVLPRLIYNATQDPIVCNGCKGKLLESYNFKMKCFATEDCLIPYKNSRDGKLKADLKMVYLAEKMKNQNYEFKELDIVCRICLNLTNTYTSLKFDNAAYNQFFEKSMPELDWNVIDGDVICENCHLSLEIYVNFIKYCTQTERKIENYQNATGINNGTGTDLQRVLEYSLKSCDTSIKLETAQYEKVLIKNDISDKEHVSVKTDITVGQETSINEGLVATGIDESIDNNIPVKEENYFDSGPDYELNSSEHCIKTEIVDIKSDCEDERNPVLYEELGQSNREYSSDSQLDICKCTKCKTAKFKADYQRNLKKHESAIIHIQPTEMEVFKCELCKTKHRSSYRRPNLIHNALSSMKLFKCEFCTYETKIKGNLRRHNLIHNPLPNTEEFKCEICCYKTKHKRYLKQHIWIHKPSSNVKVLKCELCTYETKRKRNLESHSLTHKSLSSVEVFKCEFCSYQTKRKPCLQHHILTHKPLSSVEMFKCDFCSFQTRHKRSLSAHILIHKPFSQVKIFKCELCSFGTKHKRCLVRHVQIHKQLPK